MLRYRIFSCTCTHTHTHTHSPWVLRYRIFSMWDELGRLCAIYPQQRGGNFSCKPRKRWIADCDVINLHFSKQAKTPQIHRRRNHVLHVHLHTLLRRALSMNSIGSSLWSRKCLNHACNPGQLVHTCRLMPIVGHSICFKRSGLTGCCNLQWQVGQAAHSGWFLLICGEHLSCTYTDTWLDFIVDLSLVDFFYDVFWTFLELPLFPISWRNQVP